MEHKGHPHAQGHPHGHGAKPPGKPPEGKVGKIWLPRLIAWELTRSCNLNCIHCRAAARFGPYSNELTTEECIKFLDDVKSFSDPIMIMTGGEPMLRDDIWDLARHGTDIGLRMVMAPCGFLVTIETAQKMKDSGIQRVSFSIDGATKETHDNFRRVEGAFDSVMKAIESCKAVGMDFQVNT
ncbi:MAG: radical SAM protein, partial [Deltaproteobacteria bacterium]